MSRVVLSGFGNSNVRVYAGVIVSSTTDEPSPASEVKYTARSDLTYSEIIQVVDALPSGGRPADPDTSFVNIVPAKPGDPCFITTAGGAPKLFVLTEYPQWAECEGDE